MSFEVVNNAPAANATGVSLNPTIYLTFSKDVDTATLLVSNLRLSKGAVSIPAAISYDAAGKTLNIRPQNPLPPRSKIDITVTGIRDSTGAAPSNPGFSFTTGSAAISQTLATDPVTGAPVIVGDQLDSDGRLARTITYLNSGIDGIPFNTDDVVKSYEGFAYDTAGNLLLTTSYSSAGKDGIWFNSDDAAVSSVASEYDAAGYLKSTITRMAGADGKTLTADDVITAFSIFTSDNLGNLTRTVNYSSAGADGIPFNADDVIDGYQERRYNAAGFITDRINYIGAGLDKAWFGVDDTIGTYSTWLYESGGRISRFADYTGPGGDGVRGSRDDQVSYYYKTTFSRPGIADFSYFYTAAGVDGEWFSADDPVDRLLKYERSADFTLQRQISYNGAATNVPVGYTQFYYDAGTGKLTGQADFNAPGSDSRWFTDDDIRGAVSTFIGS